MSTAVSKISSSVPEAAGKSDELVRVLEQHQLSHEEVTKLHHAIEVCVRRLLRGQADVAADRRAACSLRAAVRRFHQAWAAARHHREPGFREARAGLLAEVVVRVRRAEPR